MTSKSPTESGALPIYEDRISFLSGQWLPHHRMRLCVDDAGFRQGVTAVERLRTYAGRIFALESHLARWQHSTEALGITQLPSLQETRSHLDALLNKNHALVRSEGDVGITLFATPGIAAGQRPTFGLHLNRLDHDRIRRYRQQGQPLVVTHVKQPNPDCWPRSIKVRSRIHYYRADSIARRHHADAVGVLLDDDQSVTETSIANLAIVKSRKVISPPAERVLGGITQSVIEKLAVDGSVEWTKRPISIPQLAQADEVLMMGTDAGIWFANSLDGQPISGGTPGEVFLRLRERWDAWVGTT